MYDKNIHNEKLDLIKLLAAFAIVVLHSSLPGRVGAAVSALTRFAVPFFFMISGYYACIADVSNAITYARRKIYKTLSLIIVMEIGAFIARCSWANVADFYNWYVGWLFDFNTPLEAAHGLYSALGGYFGCYGAGWFVYALLFLYLIYIPVRKKSVVFRVEIVAAVLLMIHLALNVFVMGNNGAGVYVSNLFLMGVPSFWAGYYIHEKKGRIDNALSDGILKIILILAIVYSIAYSGFFTKSDLSLGAVTISAVVLILAQRYPKVHSDFARRFVTVGRHYSFYIYIFHLYVLEVYKNTLEHFDLSVEYYELLLWLKPFATGGFILLVCLLMNHLKSKAVEYKTVEN